MRLLGKLFLQLWALALVIGWVIADIRGDLKGTWMDQYGEWASLLVLARLVCFAIGVGRGEPNPE